MDRKERDELARIRVFHSYYGCDTGCCGHVIVVDGREVGGFEFGHPRGRDPKEWARAMVERALRGSACLATIDWSTLDVSEVSDDCQR